MHHSHLRLFTLLLSTATLTGCWTEHDAVTIRSDGTVSFRSTVAITDSRFSLDGIEQVSGAVMDDLRVAGWQLKRTWLSRSKPFELVFTGSARIDELADVEDFYSTRKINEDAYAVTIAPIRIDGEPVPRTIRFDADRTGGVSIIDASGSPVTGTQKVVEKTTYRVLL